MNRRLPFALRVLTLLVLLAAPISGAEAKKIKINTSAVPMNYTAPEQTRIGRLAWRGGIEIDSPSIRMTGLSGLLISADGKRFSAVTDNGFWITATIAYDANGFLTGLSKGRTGFLRGSNGKRMKGKTNEDAEALTELADGSILVAFERDHRILRYPPRKIPFRNNSEPLPVPFGLAEQSNNRGIEALVTLTDDSILALVEGEDDDPYTLAFLWRDGVWAQLRYQRFGNYRPSGAARLPNGDLLILERRFTLLEGLGIRLVRLPAAAVVAGALLQPVEVARLLPPLTLDNMEGIDVRQNGDGETLVYLLSDDNNSLIQRTLLLMFAYEE